MQYQQYLEKERERNAKRKEEGKVKLLKYLSEREKRGPQERAGGQVKDNTSQQ